MFVNDSGVGTITLDSAILKGLVVVRLNEFGESEFSGNENLLSSRELEFSTTEGFTSLRNSIGSGSNGKQDLTDGDTSRFTEGLTESTSHTLLESISTSAGKHLIDTNTMERMDSDSEMEVLSTDVNEHVLVGSNSGGFKSFRSDLLLFVTNKMDASWEKSVSSLLLTAIVHSNLGVWDTSVESGFWIRLVLLVPVAP